MLKQTKLRNSELIIFKSRGLNENKLKQVNAELMKVDWIGILNGTTSDTKFNQFSEKVEQILNSVAPVKEVKISAKRRYHELWMMHGLEQFAKKKTEALQENPDKWVYTIRCNQIQGIQKQI